MRGWHVWIEGHGNLHYHMQNRDTPGIYRTFQETQTGSLHQARGIEWGERYEGGSRRKGYMYADAWFMLRFESKQSSLKPLY